MKHRFSESTKEHARRLRTSLRHAKIRRRALLLKLQGLSPDDVRQTMGESNCPYYLADMSVEELMRQLAVEKRGLTLVPLLGQEPESRLGQIAQAAQAAGLPVSEQEISRQWAHGSSKEPLARAGITSWVPPYGYRKAGHKVTVVVEGEERRIRPTEIVEEEAEWVRYVFDSFIHEGLDYPQIATEMNRLGAPRRRSGVPWDKEGVRALLDKPYYCGLILYRGVEARHAKDRRDIGELFPGLHQAIITLEDFAAAQDLRGKNEGEERWRCPWTGAVPDQWK